MILLSLLLIPLFGTIFISLFSSNSTDSPIYASGNTSDKNNENIVSRLLTRTYSQKTAKIISLSTSILNLLVSLIVFILFDFSFNQFQFVQEPHIISGYNLYLGVDGISIYFVLLTTIIVPIALLSNWTSISENVKWYLIIILLLETLLLAVFLVLDIFLFYIFFESILPPLFLLIGLFGSSNRVRAGFYLFLYTLLGSLFLLLSILVIYSIMGSTDLDALYKTNFNYSTQLFLFYGIFIAFAVKTPVIFLNTWLLKAHVESPLGGSILLAGIVLKLSLYGILRLILPILPKASLDYTFIVYLICVITIIYASFSTLRTIDVKELIAYSSVSHAAVYVLGVFSNTIQGIEGGITLGLAHGFVSSGLFICAGGILYDRSSTRLITFYRGIAQIMPVFSIFFFILCLSNAGTPLSLNFLGEFLSLYGTFERLPLLGALASSSIVFSAAYTIYMFNRIAFAGKFSQFFKVNISDVNKREFLMLLVLVLFTIVLGVYPAPILDGLHYSVSSLIYYTPMN
jgi:NADH-ubiquinone oxidoreductase chain 4